MGLLEAQRAALTDGPVASASASVMEASDGGGLRRVPTRGGSRGDRIVAMSAYTAAATASALSSYGTTAATQAASAASAAAAATATAR